MDNKQTNPKTHTSTFDLWVSALIHHFSTHALTWKWFIGILTTFVFFSLVPSVWWVCLHIAMLVGVLIGLWFFIGHVIKCVKGWDDD